MAAGPVRYVNVSDAAIIHRILVDPVHASSWSTLIASSLAAFRSTCPCIPSRWARAEGYCPTSAGRCLGETVQVDDRMRSDPSLHGQEEGVHYWRDDR